MQKTVKNLTYYLFILHLQPFSTKSNKIFYVLVILYIYNYNINNSTFWGKRLKLNLVKNVK